jgi:hypothetical protein
MQQVLELMRRPARTMVVALVVSGLLVFGGTAFARFSSHPSQHAATAVRPATTTPVRVLATKTLRLNVGQTKALFTLGPISHRARCIDHGAGSFEAALQIKSSSAGVRGFLDIGSVGLPSSYGTLVAAVDTTMAGNAKDYDLMSPSGLYQHYHADYMVHSLGVDCVIRLTATNAA